MAKTAHAVRIHPLEGRIAGAAGVRITPAAPAARVSLRAAPSDAAALSKALGLDLPLAPKTTAGALPGRLAAWLGPDEWLIIDDSGDPLKDLGKAKVLCSAVDVAHRNTAILVSGPGARATLAAGCPQNLNDGVFPVGAASRTLLGKIEVVIVRTGEEDYRVECWRSFATYAFDLLSAGARDCLA